MFETKVVEKNKTLTLCYIMFFMIPRGKIWYSHTGHRWQYGACTLRAGCPKLQTHTQNM